MFSRKYGRFRRFTAISCASNADAIDSAARPSADPTVCNIAALRRTCDQFDFAEFPTCKMWSCRQHIFDSVAHRNSTADESIRQKAQDRDGGEEIANNSVLKIGMKNALLRQQAVLSALPEPKRPDRRASEADAQLLSGMRRQQQQLELQQERLRSSCVVSFEFQTVRY